MKRVPYAFLLFLLFCSANALAQIGVYGEFSAAKLNVPNTGWIFGPTLGGYYDKGHLLFLNTGIDARVGFLGTGSTQLDNGLIGPRLAIVPHVLPVKPYVEALIGAGHVNYGQGISSVSATKFEYQFLGGLDFTVFPRLDWRVVEFSYGGVSGLGSSLNPETVSTGLVVRLP